MSWLFIWEVISGNGSNCTEFNREGQKNNKRDHYWVGYHHGNLEFSPAGIFWSHMKCLTKSWIQGLTVKNTHPLAPIPDWLNIIPELIPPTLCSCTWVVLKKFLLQAHLCIGIEVMGQEGKHVMEVKFCKCKMSQSLFKKVCCSCS